MSEKSVEQMWRYTHESHLACMDACVDASNTEASRNASIDHCYCAREPLDMSSGLRVSNKSLRAKTAPIPSTTILKPSRRVCGGVSTQPVPFLPSVQASIIYYFKPWGLGCRLSNMLLARKQKLTPRNVRRHVNNTLLIDGCRLR